MSSAQIGMRDMGLSVVADRVAVAEDLHGLVLGRIGNDLPRRPDEVPILVNGVAKVIRVEGNGIATRAEIVREDVLALEIETSETSLDGLLAVCETLLDLQNVGDDVPQCFRGHHQVRLPSRPIPHFGGSGHGAKDVESDILRSGSTSSHPRLGPVGGN